MVLLPEKETLVLPTGVTIKEGIASTGIILDGPCGGRGSCGKCRVRIVDKVPPPRAPEKEIFTSQELALGWRLGCAVQAEEGMVVEVPPERRLETQQILAEGIRKEVVLRPNVQKIYLEVKDWPPKGAPPSDLEAILELAEKSVGEVKVSYPLLRTIPQVLGDLNSGLTGVVVGEELIRLEGGDTTEESYGVALDLGTTSLAATLLDLKEGRELATVSELNPQTALGEDVISRVNLCIQRQDGLEDLCGQIVEAVDRLIIELCAQAQVTPERVYELAFVGNTVMTHLFLGISPRGLAQLPFRPVFTAPLEITAHELGLNSVPWARVEVPPLIAGFVGGDTVGVILSTGIYEGDGIELAVDLGTNGEIALSSRGRLLVCSTAAGPAFEGAHIEHGMRATRGAIDRVWITQGKVGFSVIGNSIPQGICGSGLVDTVAEMLKVHILDEGGTLRSPSELRGKAPQDLRDRVKEGNGGRYFLLSRKPEVKVTQQDVREFQVAKAAIRAGIRILTQKLGIGEEEVDQVFLCGAFGNFVSKESAVVTGLLPAGLADRIRAVGNAAFEGAKLMLLSTEMRCIARDIARRAEHVNLSEKGDFHREFIKAMRFPKQMEENPC